MKYQDYKDFTVRDYKEMQLAKNDFVGMLLYQYVVVKIELNETELYIRKYFIMFCTTILR